MSLLFFKNGLGIWKIEESFDTLYSGLQNKELYEPFLNKAASPSRKIEWIAVRRLLKEMLGYEAEISYHANGAPFLRNSPFHISISHTKGFVAILLHESKKTGVDIEYYSDRIVKIAHKFINPEKEYISQEKKILHLLLHWSAKEALFKILGKEKLFFDTDLLVKPFEIKSDCGKFWIEYRTNGQSSLFPVDYKIEKTFVLTSIIV